MIIKNQKGASTMLSIEGLTPNRKKVRILKIETEFDGKKCLTIENQEATSGWSIIVDKKELSKILQKMD
jgi:hypothetical protein